MTEQEWLTSTEVTPMLEFLRAGPGLSLRKARLYACVGNTALQSTAQAIGQETVDLLKQAIERGDDLRGFPGLAGITLPHPGTFYRQPQPGAPPFVQIGSFVGPSTIVGIVETMKVYNEVEAGVFGIVVQVVAGNGDFVEVSDPLYRVVALPDTGAGASSLAEALRDIAGNPFDPCTIVPAWLTTTVVALAEGVCADQAFDRLPILADALEDAGCTDAALLGHLRGPGPHIHGCWALDAILGKE
jgi:biotin carboxyl carrier protein